MKKQIKEYWEIIKNNFLLILGVGLCIFGYFHFTTGLVYYTNRDISFITMGAIFIIIGILKLRKNK